MNSSHERGDPEVAAFALAGGGFRLCLLAYLDRKAANQLDDPVDLLFRKIPAERRHIALTVLDHLTQRRVFIFLNEVGAQVRNIQAGSDIRAFAVLGVAGGAARLECRNGILQSLLGLRLRVAQYDRARCSGSAGARDNDTKDSIQSRPHRQGNHPDGELRPTPGEAMGRSERLSRQ
jgi:hypothetical protein